MWEQGSSQPVDNDPVQPVGLRTNSFDIDFRRVISIWPYILLFGLLGYLVGSIYLRYLNFVYIVNTSLTIEQREELSIGQAFFGSQRDPFNDKIAYFRSPSLAAKLVDSLGLQYVSEAQGRFKNKDFYGIIKWHIVKDPGEDVPEINFSIMPKKKDGFHFISESVEGNAKWDEGFYLKGTRSLSINYRSSTARRRSSVTAAAPWQLLFSYQWQDQHDHNQGKQHHQHQLCGCFQRTGH